jgi:hypothetical protein
MSKDVDSFQRHGEQSENRCRPYVSEITEINVFVDSRVMHAGRNATKDIDYAQFKHEKSRTIQSITVTVPINF